MHIYIYTYIHVYMYTCIHGYIYTYIHVYMSACPHVYMHACMHAYTYTYIHVYIYTYIHIYIYTYMHIYLYTCIRICIHTYIRICVHTYTHKHTCIYSYTHTCPLWCLYIYILHTDIESFFYHICRLHDFGSCLCRALLPKVLLRVVLTCLRVWPEGLNREAASPLSSFWGLSLNRFLCHGSDWSTSHSTFFSHFGSSRLSQLPYT